jgi:hypothetical protein
MVTIATSPGAAMASGTCAHVRELIDATERHAMAMPVGAEGFMADVPLVRPF